MADGRSDCNERKVSQEGQATMAVSRKKDGCMQYEMPWARRYENRSTVGMRRIKQPKWDWAGSGGFLRFGILDCRLGAHNEDQI